MADSLEPTLAEIDSMTIAEVDAYLRAHGYDIAQLNRRAAVLQAKLEAMIARRVAAASVGRRLRRKAP